MLQTEFENKIQVRDLQVRRFEKEREENEKKAKESQVEKAELASQLNRTENELEKIKKSYLSQDQTANLLQDLVGNYCNGKSASVPFFWFPFFFLP